MIECDSCGMNLTLKDASCPYCGRENPDAIEHVRMLKYYQDQFKETKEDVMEDMQLRAPLRTRRMVVGILLCLFIFSLIFSLGAENWKRNFRKSYARGHADQVYAQVEEYMKEFDASAISGYNAAKAFDYGTDIHDIYQFSMYYTESVQKILMLYSQEYGYYNGADSIIQTLASQLASFQFHYEGMMPESYDPVALAKASVDDENFHLETIYAYHLHQQLDEMLMYYIGIPENQLDEFYSMNETEKSAIIAELLKKKGLL